MYFPESRAQFTLILTCKTLRGSVEQTEALMDCVFVPLILSEDGMRGERMMEGLHKLASFLQITAGNEKVGHRAISLPPILLYLDVIFLSNHCCKFSCICHRVKLCCLSHC